MNTAGLQKTIFSQFQQPNISKTLSKNMPQKIYPSIRAFSNHICDVIRQTKGKKETMEETIRQLTGWSTHRHLSNAK